MNGPSANSDCSAIVAVIWGDASRVAEHFHALKRPPGLPGLLLSALPLSSPEATFEGLEQLAVIPTSNSSDIELITYSVPGLISQGVARAPLMALYPTLKETGRLSLAKISPAQLAERVQALPGPLDLVIDAPGSENAVLDAAHEGAWLDRVQLIRLRCGIEQFFDGAWSEANCIDWLSRRHFRTVGRDDTNSNWVVLTFEQDPTARSLSDVTQALRAKSAELSEVRGELAERNLKAARLQDAISGKISALFERDIKLTQTLVALAKRDTALDESKHALKDLHREREVQDGEVERLSKDLELAIADAVKTKGLLERSEAMLDETKSDLTNAVLMQKMAQQDLLELRGRYQIVEAQHRMQAELLQKLTPCLQQVAHQLASLVAVDENAPQSIPFGPAEPTEKKIPSKDVPLRKDWS